MRHLLECNEQNYPGDSLSNIAIDAGESVYSGNTELKYIENYPNTNGVKKGLHRFRALGLIPKTYMPTEDAFLEVKSNNLLPGLSNDNGNKAQFVKFRGGSILADQIQNLNTDILMSQCLFGVTGNRFIMSDGRSAPMTSPKSEFNNEVISLEVNDNLSIYEIESIKRQSELIKAITKNNSLYSSLTIGLPRVGYYLHALKPYSAGLLNPELTTSWFDAVDRRYTIVLDAIKKSLDVDLPIYIVTPLDQVESLLRATVKANRPIELNPLLGRLALSDSLWSNILKTSTPSGLYQLKGDFADAIEEIRLPKESNLRLVVKNPKEEGTFELKDKLLKQAGILAPIIAMYALPQVVTLSPGKGLYQITRYPTTTDEASISRQYGS